MTEKEELHYRESVCFDCPYFRGFYQDDRYEDRKIPPYTHYVCAKYIETYPSVDMMPKRVYGDCFRKAFSGEWMSPTFNNKKENKK